MKNLCSTWCHVRLLLINEGAVFFAGVVENGRVHSWTRPVSVCVMEGPGIVMIDSSQKGRVSSE